MPAHSPADIHPLFQQAFNRGDVAALAALYEADAVMVVDGIPLVGRESIRVAFEALVARGGRIALETRAVVESQVGLAVLHGAWAIESPTGAGGDAPPRGLSTEVVRRQPDGSWLFVIDTPRTPTLADR